MKHTCTPHFVSFLGEAIGAARRVPPVDVEAGVVVPRYGRPVRVEADAELEHAETTAVDKAVEAEKATGDKPSENGHKPSGGRDGKTHRAGNNRPRRNDKGVAGPKPSRDGGKAPKADAAVNSTKMDDGSLATES